eukprot:CAMPEP_0172699960 /NCGR_PEP_ID=MMETSP1074-20121228/30562_1 /TAXON_ID=2916 /ORGANISM="Ceratium fusus, Strain PA161109" /LENGTH=83 /DNA_ID=CAMNT_0013521255 /DNA_START=427 /DNA_END=678 /DNA_ORIENTATION=-
MRAEYVILSAMVTEIQQLQCLPKAASHCYRHTTATLPDGFPSSVTAMKTYAAVVKKWNSPRYARPFIRPIVFRREHALATQVV